MIYNEIDMLKFEGENHWVTYHFKMAYYVWNMAIEIYCKSALVDKYRYIPLVQA